MHHDELDFDFDGMIKFVGLEVDEQFLSQPDDLRRSYLEALHRFNKQLEDITLRNGCEYVLADTARSMSETFIDYLNRRSQLNRGR